MQGKRIQNWMLSDEKDCRTTCFAVCRDSIPFQFCASAAVEPLKATVTKQNPSVHHSEYTFSFIFKYVQPWVKLLTELCVFFYDRLGWRWANQKAYKRSRSKKNMQTYSLNTKDSIICSKRRGCSKQGDWGQRALYAFKANLLAHTIIVATASCIQYLLVPFCKYSTKILKMGHLMEVICIDF